MTDWLLIYFLETISPQCAPEDSKRTLDEFFAPLRLFLDEIHGRFLHGGHGGPCKSSGQAAQSYAVSQFAQCRVHSAALRCRFGTCFRSDQV